MLGANGGIKVTSKYDKKLLLKINKLNFILFAIATVLAVANFVFSLCIMPYSNDTIIINIVLSSVLILCVIVFFIVLILGFRAQLKLEKTVGFELFSTFMSVSEYEHGKLVGEGKIYYENIVKSSERGKVFVVQCGKQANDGEPYYLSQVDLTAEELNTVRKLLKLEVSVAVGIIPVSDGVLPVALPESGEVEGGESEVETAPEAEGEEVESESEVETEVEPETESESEAEVETEAESQAEETENDESPSEVEEQGEVALTKETEGDLNE